MDGMRAFFCGIGGSGMLPLAMFLKSRGTLVEGSDRSFDQGRLPALRSRIEAAGIGLFPQDGSGLRAPDQVLVTSSAVEAQIPDVVAAQQIGAGHKIRAQVLSELMNAEEISIGIAGTSGKSTTTAMLTHILAAAGRDPAVVNGAPMLNAIGHDGAAMAWRPGHGPFVCEVDESDGSIALYNPSVGVILNISEDHKSMAELEELFGGYAERSQHAVLGIDSPPVAAIAHALPQDRITTVSLGGEADFSADITSVDHDGVRAVVRSRTDGSASLHLSVVGAFNVANALAALAAASRLGVTLEDGCAALTSFKGTARRLQTIGVRHGVTVIDDFAHNPDKIAASIGALTAQYARLHVLYQPHGYGALQKFRPLYEEAFIGSLRTGDHLTLTKPAYFGGTVTKTDDAEKLIETVAAGGRRATYAEDRATFLTRINEARAGDALVIMGARDDSLTDFAHDVLRGLGTP